jgi:hypothetical protein
VFFYIVFHSNIRNRQLITAPNKQQADLLAAKRYPQAVAVLFIFLII